MVEVTGGDLYSLWQVANVHLPRVSNVYTDASSALGGSDGQVGDAFSTGQSTDHGPVNSPILPAYSNVRNEMQHILAQTATNLLDSSTALNKAIDTYIEKDAATGGTIGEQYQEILEGGQVDGVQLHDPKDASTNPPTGEDAPGEPDKPDNYSSPGDEKSEDPEQERQEIEETSQEIQDLQD